MQRTACRSPVSRSASIVSRSSWPSSRGFGAAPRASCFRTRAGITNWKTARRCLVQSSTRTRPSSLEAAGGDGHPSWRPPMPTSSTSGSSRLRWHKSRSNGCAPHAPRLGAAHRPWSIPSLRLLVSERTRPKPAGDGAASGNDYGTLRAGAGLVGTVEEIVERLKVYAAMGVSRFYLQFNDLQDLGQLDLVAEQVMPKV